MDVKRIAEIFGLIANRAAVLSVQHGEDIQIAAMERDGEFYAIFYGEEKRGAAIGFLGQFAYDPVILN
jgi:hypothetical protein